MRSLIVVALSLSVLAAAGCSGGDDAASTTTSGTAAPETSSTPPETDAPATTATSVATTTAPPTTEAPTTTLDPTAALIADIEADLNAGEQALTAAGADPANPNSLELVRGYFAGVSLASIESTLLSLAADGLVARPNPDIPNVIAVRSIVEANESLDRATVELCRVDAAQVVEVLPDGRGAIVDDDVVIYQSRSEVVLQDGIWALESGEAIDGASPVTSCD